ncbi:hypothetical protein [Lysinibacillus sp. TE18511]
MSSVRDLFVEIGMEIDDDPLDELDELINEVKRSLGGFDSSGLDEIERRASEVAEEFEDLSRELRQADRGVNDLDNNTLNRLNSELAEASILANILEDEIEDITTDIMKASVATLLMGNAFMMAGMNGVMMGLGVSSAIGGIIAILAPLLVLVGGLGASFLAAGIGIAAFGAVAMSALGPVIEGADNLTASQQAARNELEKFQDFWKGFVQQFEAPVFDIFGKGLSLVQNILTGLAPTIDAVAGVIGELMNEMNNSVVGGGLKDFFTWLETHAAGAIYNFAHIFGNVFSGIFKMLGAFSPIGASIEEGLLSMTASFSEWAGNLSSSNGFQQFIDYAVENGPKLMDIFGSVFSVIGSVVTALAPLGSVVLSGLQLLTGFIASNVAPLFVEFSGWITQLAGTFIDQLMPAIMPLAEQLMPLLSEAFSTLMSALGPLAQELFPVLAEYFGNLMSLGQALVETFIAIFPTIQDIVMTVVPIVVEVFTSLYDIISSLIQNVVIPLLPMIATVISEVWSVVKPILDPLKSLLSTIGDTIVVLINEVVAPMIPKIGDFISNMWSIVKPILEAIVRAFGNVTGAIEIVVGAVKDLVSAFANVKVPDWMSSVGGKIKGAASAVGNFFNGSHATGLGRVPFDGYAAELHKDEAVLTADQSNALRDIGVLKGDGSSPQLDLSGNDSGSYKTTYSTNTNSNKVSASVSITVQGTDNPQETARSVKEELEDFFADLMSVMPTPREG